MQLDLDRLIGHMTAELAGWAGSADRDGLRRAQAQVEARRNAADSPLAEFAYPLPHYGVEALTLEMDAWTGGGDSTAPASLRPGQAAGGPVTLMVRLDPLGDGEVRLGGWRAEVRRGRRNPCWLRVEGGAEVVTPEDGVASVGG